MLSGNDHIPLDNTLDRPNDVPKEQPLSTSPLNARQNYMLDAKFKLIRGSSAAIHSVL
jgi:hypothetical protein